MPIIEDNGDVLLAADTGKDGNGRLVFSTGGFERAGINADGTASGLFGALMPAINVKQAPYNAVGNGVADDTAALQAALAAAATNPVAGQFGGGIVFVPAGTYLVTSTLVVPKQVRFVGAGAYMTKIQADDDRGFPVSTPVVRLIAAADTVAKFATTCEQMTVWCNKTADIAGSIGIYSTEANELCGVFDVRVGAFKDAGIVFERTAAQDPPADCSIERVYLNPSSNGANAGIRLSNLSGESIVRGVTVSQTAGTTTDGILVTKCGSLTITGFHAERCTNGIHVGGDSDSGGTIIGWSGHSSVTSGIVIDSSSGNWVVIGARNKGETSTIVDNFSGVTLTDTFVPIYTTTAQTPLKTFQSLDDIYLTSGPSTLKSWNFDSVVGSAQSAITAGTIYASSLPLRAGQTITKVWYNVSTVAAGTQPTSMVVGICDSTGKVVAQSAELKADTGWTAGGLKGFSLSGTYTVPASGVYYGVVLQVGSWGTTQPQLGRSGGVTISGTPILYGTGGTTGQTALPATSSTLAGGLVSTSGLRHWVAVS